MFCHEGERVYRAAAAAEHVHGSDAECGDEGVQVRGVQLGGAVVTTVFTDAAADAARIVGDTVRSLK